MTTKPEKPTYERREFLQAVAKRSAVLAGIVATAHLPYKKPKVSSFFGVKNAYAQATTATYQISGEVTYRSFLLDGATMNGLPGNPVAAGGTYDATVPEGWTGTVTPALTGYTFVPASANYTNVTGNMSQDYAAQVFTINMNSRLGPLPDGTAANIGQDAYTFTVPAGLELIIDVTASSLWAEIGLFAPGTTTSDTNLLTGTSEGLASTGTSQPINTTYTTSGGGTFTIAIEDERDNPGGTPPTETSGSYTITISAPQALGAPTQIIDNGVETMLHDIGS
ncbi:hypothetical protein ACFLT2_10925 [Acidobacteriota bacterium]